jgi:hypothetical protein
VRLLYLVDCPLLVAAELKLEKGIISPVRLCVQVDQCKYLDKVWKPEEAGLFWELNSVPYCVTLA